MTGTPAVSPGVLIGRGAERSQIAACLEAARGGEGSAVLVSGEPGPGKSALIEQPGVSA